MLYQSGHLRRSCFRRGGTILSADLLVKRFDLLCVIRQLAADFDNFRGVFHFIGRILSKVRNFSNK